jgi:hypothetical protein
LAKKARKPTSTPPGEEPEGGAKKTTQKTLDGVSPDAAPSSEVAEAVKPKAKPRKRAKPAAKEPPATEQPASITEIPPAEVAEPAEPKPKKKLKSPVAVPAEGESSTSDTESAPDELSNPEEVDGDPAAEEKVKLEYVVDAAENRHQDQDDARDQIKKIIPKKFWMIDPWRTLLDPSLAKEAEVLNYDLSKLIRDFFDMMLKEEIVDFRISGIATYSAAKMHHWKILETIKEEEKAEEQRQRERLERQIPKAIAQPLRESRKIATADDLVGAMRRAIIETMQKREKLRLRRVVREQKQAIVKQTRVKGQLPKELLQHIMGRGETLEDLMPKWLEKIKAMGSLNKDGLASFFDLCNVIKAESKSKLEERLKICLLFQSLCFLANQNSVFLEQGDLFTDIVITPHKKSRSLDEDAIEQPEDDEETSEASDGDE